MLKFLIAFGSCLVILPVSAKSYTITNQDGASIEIEKPRYDGEILSARRASDGLSFSIEPSQLTEDSWEELNNSITERMGIDLRLKSVSYSRREEEISTMYGVYEDTRIDRNFEVTAASTSYFEKPTRIVCYWISGNNISSEVHEIRLSRSEPFKVLAGGDARQISAQGMDVSGNFREAKETDFVVVAENRDGSICEIEATRDGAQAMIEEFYAKRKSRRD